MVLKFEIQRIQAERGEINSSKTNATQSSDLICWLIKIEDVNEGITCDVGWQQHIPHGHLFNFS